MTRVIAIGAGWVLLAAPCLGMAASPNPAPLPAMPSDLMARATSVTNYPTFCEIPAAPTGLRNPEGYKALVLDTRLAGARIVVATAPDTFVLADTEGFASAARDAARPPPPMSSPADGGADDFLKSARARALPPAPR